MLKMLKYNEICQVFFKIYFKISKFLGVFVTNIFSDSMFTGIYIILRIAHPEKY